MRLFFIFFPLFFSLLFSTSSFATLSCDHAKAVVPPAQTYPNWTYENSYGYADSSESSSACIDASHDGTCDFGGLAGYQMSYDRWDAESTTYSFIICEDCGDTLTNGVCGSGSDGVCDECVDIAACDCADKGGAIIDDEVNCVYHCREDDEPDDCMQKAVVECGSTEKIKWNTVDPCDYECKKDCQEEYDAALQECDNPHLVDKLTCEYSCDCSAEAQAADAACSYGSYLNTVTCEWECKCCPDKTNDCIEYCNGADNVDYMNCVDDKDAQDKCINTTSYECDCVVPPIEDPDPPGSGPEPLPPDPGDDDDPKTCADYEAACPDSCQFSCATDSSTGEVTYHNCDCDDNPADPGPDGIPGTPDDGEPGSGDDGANGWLKQIERNTNRIAENTEDQETRLKKVDKNTKGIRDDNEEYFKDNNDRSVFKDPSGKSYLKTIAEKDFTATVNTGEVNVEFPDITTTGEGTASDPNTYATCSDLQAFCESPCVFSCSENSNGITSHGCACEGDSAFSQDVANYIATGIPLVDFIEGTTMNLSSASSTLSMVIMGHSINIDFGEYVSVLDVAGNMLFAFSIISGFMIIVGRF